MKSPYVVALIQKDPVEHIPVVVGTHEVPVLNMVHGDKVFVDENADLPNGLTEAEFEPEEEYERLSLKYGADQDSKVPYVAMAYQGLHGFLAEMGADTKPKRGKAKAEA